MPGARRLRVWGFGVVGFVGAMAIMASRRLLAPDLGPRYHPSWPPVLTIVAVTIAAIIWAVVFARLSFRSEDEFGMEGQKHAVFWGNLIGLAAFAPLYVFVGLGGLSLLDPALPFSRPLSFAFALGAGLLIVLQFGGFLIALAAWRLAKR